MSRLRPFFSFYGSKWALAPYYAAPIYNRIVECCAGSASYSTLHHAKEVLLVDVDPVLCGIWEYLIRVSESELLDLPLVFDRVDEIPGLCQEARWFLGFWINKAVSHPCLQLSSWARKQRETGKKTGFWSETIRARVARQLQHIRHWKVLNASYADVPEQRATYFVDPPYKDMGKYYVFNNIDFGHLGNWCRDRAASGSQVIACEAEGATWLPFRQLRVQTKCIPGRTSGPNLRRYSEVVCDL